MSLPDLNDMYFFAQVVEHRGFAPAGRALGIPKSTLSRRIAQLEERLGAQLILRSTRSFAVTEVGRRYYNHVRAMLTEAEAAEESVALAHAEPCGLVRLSCPVALLAARVGAMLAEFMVLHPKVVLQVDETNRRVDVVAEGIDLAIRVRPPPLEDSDLVLRQLAVRRQCLVASPNLLEKYDTPTGPMDVAVWPSMDMGLPQKPIDGYCWGRKASVLKYDTSRNWSPSPCWHCAMRQWQGWVWSNCQRCLSRMSLRAARCSRFCRNGLHEKKSSMRCMHHAAASCRQCVHCWTFWWRRFSGWWKSKKSTSRHAHASTGMVLMTASYRL